MRMALTALLCFAIVPLAPGCGEASHAQGTGSSSLDMQVRAFLDEHRGTWRDLNVPESDGRLLYDLILKNRFTRALEIGTSTGHSGIWIAWAFSKAGGRLITIEIDPRRHREAVSNFKEAGLSSYIDARLGDAHQIVPALEGPFDFVFSDADKEWYTNYFSAVWPKVAPGGCFTAHNVGSARQRGIREFLEHLKTVRDGTTTIDRTSSAGISITCKGGSRQSP
jgi:predicted O-methyltransferase YrrM